jgi:quercetin dioxygenase-like cupin family protein
MSGPAEKNALIIRDLGALTVDPPGASAAAVYDRPIGLRVLYEDPRSGAEHYLVRYPPGVTGRVHVHTAAHTIVVLAGRLDVDGEIVGPGGYAHFPAGRPMCHQATPDAGCLFVLIFDGPFDVRVVDDPPAD